MKNVALIFAGGIGSRMHEKNNIPKQFLEWNGKAIIIHTLNIFEEQSNIDAIVVVSKKEWVEYTKKLIKNAKLKKIVSVVAGGSTALESQYNGLEEIEKIYGNKESIAVLIHDGVRPLVDGETIQKNIESVKTNGNAITVTEAIETIIKVDNDNHICDILDRKQCMMAKAPQSFLLEEIIKVHRLAQKEGNYNFIDSASMMRAYGYKLYTIQGKPENIKITTPSDYYMFLGISKNKENNE